MDPEEIVRQSRIRFLEELRHHMAGWVAKAREEMSANAYAQEFASLRGDLLYSNFGFAIPEYVLIRLMGRMSISIGRRLGEIYDKVQRFVVARRLGLSDEQATGEYGPNNLRLDIRVPIDLLNADDEEQVRPVTERHLPDLDLTGGLAIEVRYNFNPNNSARLCKDASFPPSKGTTYGVAHGPTGRNFWRMSRRRGRNTTNGTPPVPLDVDQSPDAPMVRSTHASNFLQDFVAETLGDVANEALEEIDIGEDNYSSDGVRYSLSRGGQQWRGRHLARRSTISYSHHSPSRNSGVRVARAVLVRLRRSLSGRVADALDDYRKVLEIAPHWPQVRLRLAGALTRNNKADAAWPHFEELLRQSPKDADILLGAARCERALGQPEKALAHLDALFLEHPEHGEAWAERGRTLAAQGDKAGALAALRRAVGLEPNNYQTGYARFLALSAQGFLEEATPLKARLDRLKSDEERLRAISEQLGKEPQAEKAAYHCNRAAFVP